MPSTALEIPVGVVIPAAGSGSRLGGERKQFRLLGGRPLLAQTAAVFQRHPRVSSIVLVVSEEDIGAVSEMASRFGLKKVADIVAGGRTRQESVGAGLAALPLDLEIVLTHDAVRPFVSESEITSLIEHVERSGAASIAAPISDTLVRSAEGMAGETVDREGLFRMLTPQGFRRDILETGHRSAVDSGMTYTDEATLVRATGVDVVMVGGSPINVKITTAADWDLAQKVWPAWSK